MDMNYRRGHLIVFFLNCRIGLDLVNGKPRDNKQAGVFEPTIVKVKSLKFATEVTITILWIDDLIKLHPESKDDKHGGYEDAVHSGALDDWAVLFVTMLDAACLYLEYYTLKCNRLPSLVFLVKGEIVPTLTLVLWFHMT